jgi:hypothetical protein
MATYTLKVEMTPAEAELVDKMGTLAVDQKTKDRNRTILAERGRAIDQVKRLYAVVMGYALTTCLTNAYLCSRVLQKDTWEALSILIAPVITFVSLISLFYLGSERMLDRKYLQEDQIDPPTRTRLWIDLATLGISGVWFVILANIFQPPLAGAGMLDLPTLHDFQARFITAIIFIYILDLGLLALQAAPIGWEMGFTRAWKGSDVFRTHVQWLGLNVVSLLALWGITRMPDSTFLGVSIIALSLAVFHIIRFFVDFGGTFRFYYPHESLASG